MSFPRFVPNAPLPDCPAAKAANSANLREAGNPELATLAGLADLQSQNRPDTNSQATGEPRAIWPRTVTPDSHRPLIPPRVRTKIEVIEADARAKGWPAELLWNSGFWDCPRGLAAVLDADDEIAEVTGDYIAILKVKRNLLRFQRHNA